jgi:hypothetical protein
MFISYVSREESNGIVIKHGNFVRKIDSSVFSLTSSYALIHPTAAKLEISKAETIVSSDGILLDEEAVNSEYLAASRNHGKPLNYTGTLDNFKRKYIDEAVLIARIFIVLGCPNIGNNLSINKTQPELSQEARNRDRVKRGLERQYEYEPVVFDLTRFTAKKSGTPQQQMRVLLGITDVQESHTVYHRTGEHAGKPWVRKDGQTFKKKGHKRKIAADMDRTKAPRRFKSSNNEVKLDLVSKTFRSGDKPSL